MACEFSGRFSSTQIHVDRRRSAAESSISTKSSSIWVVTFYTSPNRYIESIVDGSTDPSLQLHGVARLNCPCANGSARRGQPARLGRDGLVCGLLERSRHAHPMDPRRSWLRNPIGRRLPVALTVPAGLASEAVSSKKRPGRVNASPVDGSWRLDFAGAPHCDQYHCSSDDRLNRQVLLHLPVSLSSRPARPTDDSQEHITIGRSPIARGWPWPCRPAERTSSAREAHPCDRYSCQF